MLYFGCQQQVAWFGVRWVQVGRRGRTKGGHGAGKADACPKTDSLHWQWARAFIDRGRDLHAETAWSALTNDPESGHWWSDQSHFDCFRYS